MLLNDAWLCWFLFLGFRLQSVTPVSYVEVRKVKAEKPLGDKKDLVRVGLEPEVYTEEHDKLLGSCEKSWDLFEDGYDADGKRIYDPINGKTCHQCRLGFSFLIMCIFFSMLYMIS